MPTKAELEEKLAQREKALGKAEEQLAQASEEIAAFQGAMEPEEDTPDIEPQLPERKIAIVGAAMGSIHLTPDDDPTWEIWACSRAFNHLSRWDRHYEIHDLEYLRIAHPEVCLGDDGYFAWMRKQEGEIWMQEKFPYFPGSRKYPKDEVLRKFPRYFESTIAWMTAHALLESQSTNITTLGVYGVSMDVPDEYAFQKANMEFLLGIAHGKGIRVIIPAEARLLKGRRLYGFETLGNSDVGRHVIGRRERMKKQVVDLDKAIETATNNRAELRGALQDIQWLEQNWL